MNTQTITPEQSKRLYQDAMIRMRWRLWFAFAESKYEEFRYRGNPKKPYFKNIKEYCLNHWGKEIANMTKEELSEYIAIVTKWK